MRTTIAHTPGWSRHTRWLVLAAFAVEPVWHTVSFGQINLTLAALVAIDVCRWRGSRYGGMLAGVASAIKLTPLIFVLYLAVSAADETRCARRARCGAQCGGGTGAAVGDHTFLGFRRALR